MKKILDLISEEMELAFEKAGYKKELGRSKRIQKSSDYDCKRSSGAVRE